MKSKTSFSFHVSSRKRRSWSGVDHRLVLDAHHAPRGVLPQRHVVLPEAELRLHQLGRIGHQPGRHLQEGAADVERIGGVFLLRLALQPFADDALRSFGDVGHRAADHGGVGHLERGPFGVLGYWHSGVLSVGGTTGYMCP